MYAKDGVLYQTVNTTYKTDIIGDLEYFEEVAWYQGVIHKYDGSAWSATSYKVQCSEYGKDPRHISSFKDGTFNMMFDNINGVGTTIYYTIKSNGTATKVATARDITDSSGRIVSGDDCFHIFGDYTAGVAHIKYNSSGTKTTLTQLPGPFWNSRHNSALDKDGNILFLNCALSYRGGWVSSYDVPIMKYTPLYSVSFS